MLRPAPFCVVAVLVTVTACERPGDPARARAFASRVLKGALAYPRSTVVSISAGEDAAEVALTTGAAPQNVATWYRQALVLNGWELKSDVVERDSTITIYAEKEKRPLWVRLRANAAGLGTTYRVIGAIVPGDSVR